MTWFALSRSLPPIPVHYPNWELTIDLDEIFRQIMADQRLRSVAPR
jgi:hypothetical protein